MQDELTIGQVARQTGLRTSAVRYYESAGLLPEPPRRNGRRRYDPAAIQMLRIIQLAQQAGFTIAEIRSLFAGFAAEAPPDEQWRPLVERKLQEVEHALVRGQQMRALLSNLIRCGSARLEDCLLPQAERPSTDAHTSCTMC